MSTRSRELLDKFGKALSEVRRQDASGKLDGSGRFYTDQELTAGAATGRPKKSETKNEEPAA